MLEILQRLEAVARDLPTVLPAEAISGASADDLRALEQACGVRSLPDELKQLYSWHDGGGGEKWFGGGGFWEYLRIKDVVRLIAEWRMHSMDLTTGGGDEVAGAVVDGVWPKSWIPFADWNGEIFLVFDASGLSSHVLVVDIESAYVKDTGDSLTQFFEKLLSLRSQSAELSVDKLLGR